jgi:tRNA (cytidine32/uridine32-2'-O)-methyltransferase
LRMKLLSPSAEVESGRPRDGLATADAIEQFYTHLREVLIEIDFLKPSNPKRLLQRLRRMFNRIRLENMEVNMLRGILTQVQLYGSRPKTERSVKP